MLSIDRGKRESVDGTGVWVDGGLVESSDTKVLLSVDKERASLWIVCSKLAGSG